jgi:type IV secretory pathway TrbF-like protein
MPKDINEARQLYLEQYGSALVVNNYLRIALFLVSAGLIGSVALSVGMFVWAKNQKPLVLRIDDVGRITPTNYAAFDYKPEERELRYFLSQFVQHHFARMVASVNERYGESLYFLDAKLSQALIDEERRSQSLAKFIREGTEETDIVVNNIALQDLRAAPMKATVDFEKVFFSRADHHELRRERYAGYFEFVVRENVPNSFGLVNPLGLTITYFRTDEAFR